jgi:RNA polymerase sigma-70 factor (ECF subfamily)
VGSVGAQSGGTGGLSSQRAIVTEQEFVRLYDRAARALRSYLRLLCRNAALADDLLQESFLRILHVDVSRLDEHQLKSYLYRAATSAAMDHFRAHKREMRGLSTVQFESESNLDLDLPHDMKLALRALKPQQQVLLWLAYVEGFEHREIAPLLGLGEKSIRVLLFRARQELAAVLKEREVENVT